MHGDGAVGVVAAEGDYLAAHTDAAGVAGSDVGFLESRRATRGNGATGAWLRLIAIRCTYCGCVYTGNGPARMIRGWYDGMHSGWSAVHA